MYRSLLVPLDGCPAAEQALQLALSIAKRTGAEVQLVYVHRSLAAEYPELCLLDDESWATEWKTRRRDYLDNVGERLRAAGAKTVTPFVLQGDVAEAIRNHVIETKTSLVVMTTHARGPIGRLWLGSVADRLIRELPIPVLLVRPGEMPVDWSADVSLGHFLIPVDGTALAEQILEPAVALGEVMNADFTLMRVNRPAAPIHYPPDGAMAAPLPEGMREQLARVETEARLKAEEYLDQIAQRLRRRLLRVRTSVVDDAHPALAVIDAAQRLPADLIAMQTHGRSGLSRFVLGSVADKVLRGTRVPLLLHRPTPPPFPPEPAREAELAAVNTASRTAV